MISFYSEKDKTPHQSSLLITNTRIICLICMFRFASRECDNFTDRKQLLMFASSHRAFCDGFNRHIKIEMRCLVQPPACSAVCNHIGYEIKLLIKKGPRVNYSLTFIVLCRRLRNCNKRKSEPNN